MYTQGPWSTGVTAGGSICIRENGRANAEIAILCPDRDRPKKEDVANARLIAAAPDLLKAAEYGLQILQECYINEPVGCGCDACNAIHWLEKTIAKAERK